MDRQSRLAFALLAACAATGCELGAGSPRPDASNTQPLDAAIASNGSDAATPSGPDASSTLEGDAATLPAPDASSATESDAATPSGFDAAIIHHHDAATPAPPDAASEPDATTPEPGDASAPPSSDASSPGPAPIPSPIFGVTADDVSSLSQLSDSVSSLARKPTVRVVFDYPQPASDYTSAVPALHQVAYVMGQLMDSSYMQNKNCLTDLNLAARLTDYMDNATLLSNVEVWEIGNEVNGEWLCNGSTANTYTAVRQMYDKAKAKGVPTALTLFWYDSSCAPASENEMFTWVNDHVEQDMRLGLDYVLISVYETACPPPASWTPIFDQLGQLFPNSWLGFGETGTENQNAPQATKLTILDKYYGFAPMHARFVGGDFWWYFAEDMVPKTKPLWTELNNYATSWSTLYP